MPKVKRVLISVYDKNGVEEFAKSLRGLGIEIISSGGTYAALKKADVEVTEISEYTNSPEVMGGRVKTLHPRVHAGILYRRGNKDDEADLETLGAKSIDMVVVNLYPFAEAIAKPDCDMQMALKNIDIGGPTMIRAAAKNWPFVAVVTDADDYNSVIDELKNNGEISENKSRELATKAFGTTADYDSMITSYLGNDEGMPSNYSGSWSKHSTLRYGENPHQKAAVYKSSSNVSGPNLVCAKQIQGKAISYNNLLDSDAAIRIVRDYDTTAVAVLKHNNPCGVGLSENVAEAFVRARECDPMSAFGGIIAANTEVDGVMAEEITSAFYEVVIAPSFSDKAKEILKSKKNLRLLEMPELMTKSTSKYQHRVIAGGLLVQEDDVILDDEQEFKVVTKRKPTPEEEKALKFAWKVVKHVKSNAVIFCRENETVGIGAGQMSRVDAVKVAKMKALSSLKGTVIGSDAFFPFADGLIECYEAGATAVIQPGGSKRDQEVIDAANERNMTMIFTGKRHFKH